MLIFPDAPEVSTTELAMQTVIMGRTLDLTCNFDAVPIPDATFIRNGVALDESDCWR